MIKITMDTGHSVDTLEAKGFLLIAQTEVAYELHKFNVTETMEKHLREDLELNPTKKNKTWKKQRIARIWGILKGKPLC